MGTEEPSSILEDEPLLFDVRTMCSRIQLPRKAGFSKRTASRMKGERSEQGSVGSPRARRRRIREASEATCATNLFVSLKDVPSRVLYYFYAIILLPIIVIFSLHNFCENHLEKIVDVYGLANPDQVVIFGLAIYIFLYINYLSIFRENSYN